MKKWLACLLVWMILPVSVLAQGVEYNWALDMPEDALVDLVQTLETVCPEMGEVTANVNDTLLRGVAKLLDELEIRVNAQEALTEISIGIKGEKMIDAALISQENGVMLTIDALPKIALALPVTAGQTAMAQTAVEVLTQTDWTSVTADADALVDQWLTHLPTALEMGNFAGEAYTGGLYRMTYQLDDRDLFVLAETLLRYENLLDRIPALETLLELYGVELETVIDLLCGVAYEAAQTNDYTYLIHSISDGEYLTGLSAIAYQRGQQVGTLSVGWPENGLKAVLGYGYQGQNIYFAVDADEMTTHFSMVRDGALNGYTAAKMDPENELLCLTLTGEDNGSQASMNAVLTGTLLQQLEIASKVQLDASLSDVELRSDLSVNGREVMQHTLFIDRSAAITEPDLADLRVVEVDEYGNFSEDISSQIQSMAATLGIRLFKVLPMELLTSGFDLMELFQ